MKKIILATGIMIVAMVSCKKDNATPNVTPTPADTTDTTTTPPPNTNGMAGDWHATIYDNTAVTAPQVVLYQAAATSATAGIVKFDITFDGSTHNTEDVTYTLSASNTKVDFVKTGGTIQTLSGGGTWTINKMDATSLEMTSSFGLIMKFAK
jgi:uncharacterized lipoprotein YbaY